MIARMTVLTMLLAASPVAAEQMRGVVTSVDGAKKELVLEGRGIGKRGKSFTFTFAKDLSVTWDGKDAAADDISANQNVRVTYETQGGDLLASKIEIQGKRPVIAVKAGGDSVAGLLRRVAWTEREIIVATPGTSGKETYTTLPVPEDAKVSRDGKVIAFTDLQEEETATVKVEVRDGKKVAAVIAVGQAVMAKEEKSEESSTISKIRLGLKIADAVLAIIEKQKKKD